MGRRTCGIYDFTDEKGEIKVSERIRNVRTFSHYVTAYFMVLLVVSGVILVGTLWYSSNMLLQAERQSEQKNMQLAADNLEKQFQMLESIAVQIGITTKYRPNVLSRNQYKEIVMLEDFTKYANYSPLSVNYFLAYRSEKKIYTFTGNTTYFEYYGPSVLGIPYEQADEIFGQILDKKKASFLYSEPYVLSVFPVRFYGYDKTNAYNAVLCFVLTKPQIQRYLEQVCAGLPEQYAVMVNGEVILDKTDMEIEVLTGASDCMNVISSDGKIRLYAPVRLKGWQLLLDWDSAIFYIGVGFCGVLILLIAFAMAHISLLPLNRLIEKYVPNSSKFERNFRQLDSILGNMTQMNADIRFQLRNHLLNLILRGEYSEGMLERWSMTGIVFDRSLYCVYLMKKEGQADVGNLLGEELEKLRDLDIDFYIVVMEHIDMTAVIAGYDSSVTHQQVTEMLRLAASECTLELCVGRPVDSPKRLPLSMMSAQTAGSYRGSTSASQKRIQTDFLAERLVAAAECGSQSAMEEVSRDIDRFLMDSATENLLRKQNLYEFLQNVLRKADEHGVEVDKSEVNSLVLLSDISMTLCDLQKLLLEAADKTSQNRLTGNDASKLLVEYVIANAYDPDINLQELSDRFGLSSDYISSMIKKETGFSFKEYLTMLRIAEGKRLLTEEKSLTVNDVAMRVGYRKASNFSKKFKELTGMQPSQVR